MSRITSALLEMWTRYGVALAENAGWIACGILVAALCCFFVPRPFLAPTIQKKSRVLWIALLALALLWAWSLRWLSDDAYISFRYADNLAHGHGLVFNPGERVEGYSNFLWTALIALSIKLGLDPGQVALILGLICYLGSVVTTYKIGRQISQNQPRILVPVAAIVLAANYTFASFATSGLETMFCTFLVLIALERVLSGHFLVSGLFGIAATMAHPDHAIFYAALGIAIALEKDASRKLVRFAAPFIAIYVPYYFIRWRYYGDFFPNTYYAKAAAQPYFNQGVIYIGASLVGGGLLGAVPLFINGAVALRKSLLGRYVLISTPIYFLYVAKIGGDFMYGRLFCPFLPILFLLAEHGARDLLAKARYRYAFAGLALLTLAAVPTKIIRPWEKAWLLADERTFYKLTSFSPIGVDSNLMEMASFLKRRFVDRGLRPFVATDCVGIVAYRTKLPMLDMLGLNDRAIAHMPLDHRSRPGHERLPTQEYLLHRGVDFTTFPIYWGPHANLAKLRVEGRTLQLLRYNEPLLKALRRDPDVSFMDMAAYLDGYLRNVARMSGEQLEQDFRFFDAFYFSTVNDPSRKSLFQKALAEKPPR